MTREKSGKRGLLHKRQHKRYRPRKPTFVRLRSETEEDVGQLIEISKGGLSIRYFVNEEKRREYAELSIFPSDSDFAVEGIPITNVSDTDLKDLPFETEILRRHGIKFDKMTPDQIVKLDEFLTSHTVGEDDNEA